MTGLALDGMVADFGARRVLDGIGLTVPRGTFLAVVGPNGAGKTTLVRAVAGLVPVDGTARLGHLDLADLSAADRARLIAYLPQRADVAWPLAVRDAVALGRLPHGDPFGRPTEADRAAVAAVLKRLGLEGFAGRPVTALSGGERARVMLARVLATEASVILADEPTAALDPAQQFAVLDLLRAEAAAGRIVLAVLHDLALAARFADRVAVLDAGRLVAEGPPGEVLTENLLADVFGLACLFLDIEGRRVPVPLGRV